MSDPAELATVVAECVAHLEAGLRLLDRPANAGEVAVDLAGVDAGGRLALVLCDLAAGPETVLRALEAQAWWREQGPLAARVFADAGVDPHAPPRAFVVATRWSDRALRLLRALGPLGPVPVECRIFRDAEGATVVSLDRLDAPEPARPTPAARASGDAEAQRAAGLIERLERLRFSEVFR